MKRSRVPSAGHPDTLALVYKPYPEPEVIIVRRLASEFDAEAPAIAPMLAAGIGSAVPGTPPWPPARTQRDLEAPSQFLPPVQPGGKVRVDVARLARDHQHLRSG